MLDELFQQNDSNIRIFWNMKALKPLIIVFPLPIAEECPLTKTDTVLCIKHQSDSQAKISRKSTSSANSFFLSSSNNFASSSLASDIFLNVSSTVFLHLAFLKERKKSSEYFRNIYLPHTTKKISNIVFFIDVVGLNPGLKYPKIRP